MSFLCVEFCCNFIIHIQSLYSLYSCFCMAFFSFVCSLVLFSLFPFNGVFRKRTEKKTAFWMETMCRIQFVHNFCKFSFAPTFARFTIKAAKLLIWETYKCWNVKNDEQNIEPMTECWILNQPIQWSVLRLSFIIIKPNKQSKLINFLKHLTECRKQIARSNRSFGGNKWSFHDHSFFLSDRRH